MALLELICAMILGILGGFAVLKIIYMWYQIYKLVDCDKPIIKLFPEKSVDEMKTQENCLRKKAALKIAGAFLELPGSKVNEKKLKELEANCKLN